MLSFHVKFVQTDRRTTVRQYAPIFRWGHKKRSGFVYTKQSPLYHIPYKKPFENCVRKGEHACNKNFILFPQCFKPFKTNTNFSVRVILSSANAFNSDQSKILLLGKKLNVSCSILFCSKKTSRYRHSYVNTSSLFIILMQKLRISQFLGYYCRYLLQTEKTGRQPSKDFYYVVLIFQFITLQKFYFLVISVITYVYFKT